MIRFVSILLMSAHLMRLTTSFGKNNKVHPLSDVSDDFQNSVAEVPVEGERGVVNGHEEAHANAGHQSEAPRPRASSSFMVGDLRHVLNDVLGVEHGHPEREISEAALESAREWTQRRECSCSWDAYIWLARALPAGCCKSDENVT